MRLLKLTELRDVSLEEIQRAARCWAREQRTNPKAQSYGNSASFFVYAAKKWLRFHGRLKRPSAPPMRFADQLNYFARYMAEEQGFSPYSVRSHCAKTSKFLEWFGERHRLLTRAKIEDVDEFLAMKGAGRWSRRSVSVAAQALRAFFRYAETRGWCATGFAKGIQGPKIYKYEGVPGGPSWEQVCRLLRSVKGSNPAVRRARAILSLLAIYGLRTGEVSRLMLRDFDWREEEYVRKGTKLYIEGKLQTTSWQDRQSGEKKYRTEIVARDLVLLGSCENRQNATAQAAGHGLDTEPSPAVVEDNIPF